MVSTALFTLDKAWKLWGSFSHTSVFLSARAVLPCSNFMHYVAIPPTGAQAFASYVLSKARCNFSMNLRI